MLTRFKIQLMICTAQWKATAAIDLIIVFFLTLILMVLVYVIRFEPMQVVIGLLAVLFLPGYLIISVLYPSNIVLNTSERLGLSVGFSIAIIPLLGLGLNITPWGITRNTMLVSLGIWNIIFLLEAWRRRLTIPLQDRSGITFKMITDEIRQLRQFAKTVGYLFLVIGLGVLLGVTIWKIQQPVPSQSFTEFYLLGNDGLVENYPTELIVDETQPINLGIVNQADMTYSYHTEVLQAGSLIGLLPSISLDPGEHWDGSIEVTPIASGQAIQLEFHLFRSSESNSFMTLSLFVNVAGG